jgi:hypothetical protein
VVAKCAIVVVLVVPEHAVAALVCDVPDAVAEQRHAEEVARRHDELALDQRR